MSPETKSAMERFNALVAVRMEAYGEKKHVAWQKVCRAEPALRAAMVAEANAERPRRR